MIRYRRLAPAWLLPNPLTQPAPLLLHAPFPGTPGPQDAGSMFLESGNVNLSEVYFYAGKLKTWKDAL